MIAPRKRFHRYQLAALLLATPTVALAGGTAVIDTFEDGDLVSERGVGWQEENDGAAQGTSRAELAVVEDGAAGTGRALRVAGTVTTDFQHGWAGASALLNETGDGVDVSGYQGIRFYLRGDGELYEFQVLCSSVKDNNHFRKEIRAPEEWTLFEVPFSEIGQSPYWGKQVPWTGKDVYGLSFQTSEAPIERFTFEVDEISFF